ncbi:hypothetical protein HC931_19335 [Candidatus Gracilibacteria bacterium]|jgi:AraC-like ligand binding domain|nr:hypothetical protein [Candidatus Gracilibacteria bacterium]NJM87246.1 hypothetical protein [Hydrococcus sp. RU_2_2]NJP18639.1 hypothetical protein [Hydrococcus sp. CRU_1_1]NJQ98029.1 hypothetical protein [Hydrococcus sp. CSU_1_8]
MQIVKDVEINVQNKKFWLIRELDNLEMLYAKKVVSSSARHTHETLAIGAIAPGSAILNHQGSNYATTIDSAIVINLDEPHKFYRIVLDSLYYLS